MSKSFDLRRVRPLGAALTAVALSLPFVLPLAAPGPDGFVREAVAQEMQKVDTSKLVTIGGAVTEIVYALGEGDRLVARDSTSMYPEEALKLPDVGYMRALSPEGVKSMELAREYAKEEFAATRDFEVLWLNQALPEETRHFRAETGATLPMLSYQDKVNTDYHVRVTPFLFMIDPSGVIRAKGLVNTKNQLDWYRDLFYGKATVGAAQGT